MAAPVVREVAVAKPDLSMQPNPMDQLAKAKDKLKEWQQQYAPDVAQQPKAPLPWASKKVYGNGVVIETAKARRITKPNEGPNPQAKAGQ